MDLGEESKQESCPGGDFLIDLPESTTSDQNRTGQSESRNVVESSSFMFSPSSTSAPQAGDPPNHPNISLGGVPINPRTGTRPLNAVVSIVSLKRGTGKGYLIQDYVFLRDRLRNGNLYLKCRNRPCKARAIISHRSQVFLAGAGHNPTCQPASCGRSEPPVRSDPCNRPDPAPKRTSAPRIFPHGRNPMKFPSSRWGTAGGRPGLISLGRPGVVSCGNPGFLADSHNASPDDDIGIKKEPSFDSVFTATSLEYGPQQPSGSRIAEGNLYNPSTGGINRPYPVSLNQSSTSEIDNDGLFNDRSQQCGPLVRELQPVEDSSSRIRDIFKALHDVRHRVQLLFERQNFPPLINDLILRAARGEATERVPVWVMRQAGRYLPEFQAVRKEHDFFEICQTPELACEITLQPICRFELDAAIIFSDILVIPQVLGIHVEMITGKGLVFDNTLTSPEDLERLNKDVDVTEALSYVFDAITLTRKRLEGKVPLIGFSGAPWTLMGYCIEGTGNSLTLSKAKKWLYTYPERSHQFLQLLTDKVVDYLVGQVLAGAQLLQVFDSNVGVLGHDLFMTFALPYLIQIVTKVKSTLREANVEPVPMMVFAKGAHHALADLSKTGYDVISLDWTIQPELARAAVSTHIVLQGNLDPCAMYGSKDDIEHLVGQMLRRYGTQRYIANLGHGVYPDFDPENVRTFIDTVHEQSEAINKRNAASCLK